MEGRSGGRVSTAISSPAAGGDLYVLLLKVPVRFEGEGNTQKNNSIYTSKKSSTPNNTAHVCTKMFLLLLNPNRVVLYCKP